MLSLNNSIKFKLLTHHNYYFFVKAIVNGNLRFAQRLWDETEDPRRAYGTSKIPFFRLDIKEKFIDAVVTLNPIYMNSFKSNKIAECNFIWEKANDRQRDIILELRNDRALVPKR